MNNNNDENIDNTNNNYNNNSIRDNTNKSNNKNYKIIFVILLSILIIILSFILLFLTLIFINKAFHANVTPNIETIEKSPKQLAEEEIIKLKNALISEGYTTINEIVYEKSQKFEDGIELIYTFSFSNYSFNFQSNLSGSMLENYYLISDTANGNWIYKDGNYEEVINYTYNFNNHSTFCQRTTPYSFLTCTYYTNLQNLKNNFIQLSNKYEIDLDILLYR